MSTAFEKALARHFQLQQAKSNPAGLAAAAQIVITAVNDAHPQLVHRLLGKAVQQEAGKVCDWPVNASYPCHCHERH